MGPENPNFNPSMVDASEGEIPDWVKDKQIKRVEGNVPLPDDYVKKGMPAVEGVVPTGAEALKEQGDAAANKSEIPEDEKSTEAWKNAYEKMQNKQ